MRNRFSLEVIISAGLLLVLPATATAQIEFVDDLNGLTEQEKAWLEGDAPKPNSTDHINEGDLNWLSFPGKKGEYHLENQMIISNDSLKTGWIRFIQCHYNLDPISKVEVVYKPKSVKNLEIRHHTNMGMATAQEYSVVLSNVRLGGEVCISGESNTLKKSGAVDDRWIISRGPYMRKFFDGFYPMQLTEILDWSSTNLVFNDFGPKSATGQNRNINTNMLKVNYRFEGMLRSEYEFSLKR